MCGEYEQLRQVCVELALLGVEVARRMQSGSLRKWRKSDRTLVTAADEAEADPVPSSAGVVATLGKPFDPLYLLSQVRRALRRAGSRGLECPPVRLRGAPLVRERRRTWRAVPARWLPPGGTTLVGPAGNG